MLGQNEIRSFLRNQLVSDKSYGDGVLPTRMTKDEEKESLQLMVSTAHERLWDPDAIDLLRDQATVRRLDRWQKNLLKTIVGSFLVFEGNVIDELEPFIDYNCRKERFLEVSFLCHFREDEKRHHRAFDRYREQVLQEEDLDKYVLPSFRRLVAVEMPKALSKLEKYGTPYREAGAIALYMLVCEGIVGLATYKHILEPIGSSSEAPLPGLKEIGEKILKDESRHVGYGKFAMHRLLSEHPVAAIAAIRLIRSRVAPLAKKIFEELFHQTDPLPLGNVKAARILGISDSLFDLRFKKDLLTYPEAERYLLPLEKTQTS